VLASFIQRHSNVFLFSNSFSILWGQFQTVAFVQASANFFFFFLPHASRMKET
jgi:hypothetical protein